MSCPVTRTRQPKNRARAKIGKGVGIPDRYAWKIFLPYTDLIGPGGWLLANCDWKIASNTDLFSLTLFGDAANRIWERERSVTRSPEFSERRRPALHSRIP